MSFSFRDKPRLSERLRGKSGDEVFDELQKALDENKKEREKRRNMFFESGPKFDTSRVPRADTFFSQAGYPFDDDFKSRIDNLAQRHPESADLLRNIIGNTWKAGSGNPSNLNSEVNRQHPSEGASSNHPENSNRESNKENIHEIKPNLSEDSMRNTVQRPNQEEDDSRNQRSWSAPPEAKTPEPQRFVSKIEINPVNPDETNMNNSTEEQPQAPPQPPPQPSKQPNVRHIPIFVEGRSEPVLPKEPSVEEIFNQTRAPAPTFNARQPYQQFTSPKKNVEKQHFVHRDPPTHTNQHQQHPNEHQQPPNQHHQHVHNANQQSQHPQQHQAQQQHQQHKHQQHHQPQQQQHENENVAEQAPPPPPPAPPKPKTAMEKVEAVQKEVDDLRKQVNEFQGKSRQEKQYLYLDEMLTRELIKLDNIETEGKEDVRMARKNAIKSIQNAIGVLESKVPLPPSSPVNNVESSETSLVLYGQDANSEAPSANSEQMEVEPSNNSARETSTDESTEVKKKKNNQ